MVSTNIVIKGSWQHAIQLETLIKSVVYYNDHVDFYILNNNIAQEWFYHINTVLKPLNCRVIDRKLDGWEMDSKVFELAQIAFSNNFRDVDRVIYLDLNTVIRGNISNLYVSQTNDYDWVGFNNSNELFMLMNLNKLRQDSQLADFRDGIIDNSLNDDEAHQVRKILNELGEDLSGEFLIKNNHGHLNNRAVLQFLSLPWKNEINDQNQYWWRFFGTEWSLIINRELLVPAETLVSNNQFYNDHSSNRMQIIMAANYNYQQNFLTTIKSVLYYNHNVDIHLINPDIPSTWFNALNNLIWPSQIVDEKISNEKLDVSNVSKKLSHVNNMTNALLYLHEIVNCPRAIYLDSDVLVNRELTSFYEMDLQGKPFAASPEMIEHQRTINVGVMLLDLDKLRDMPNLSHNMVDYYQTHDVPVASESVITHFFSDNYLKLGYNYDYQIGREKVFAEYYDYNQLEKSINDFYCIHYITSDKPWNTVSYSRHRELWWLFSNLSMQESAKHILLYGKSRYSSDNRVMICTGDQNVAHLDELIQALPEFEFDITAHSAVGWNLIRITQDSNVHVYPEVLDANHQKLGELCSVVLDIGYGVKDTTLLESSLDEGKFVMSFESVKDGRFLDYPNYLVFDDNEVDSFVEQLRHIILYSDLRN